jgi:hypothetical protein
VAFDQTQKRPKRRRYVALLDFDGLLCDMEPFAYELANRDAPQRWGRFFGHTSEAAPIQAGVELVAALRRVGWRYAVSSTRPLWSRSGVCRWVRENMPAGAGWTYVYRTGGVSAAECKRQHYVEAMVARSAPVCGLFVDDELAVVDELVDLGVPAVHIDELAGLSDEQLRGLLEYSVKGADQRRRELRAQARANGMPPTMRDQAMVKKQAAAMAKSEGSEGDTGSCGEEPVAARATVVNDEFTDGALSASLDGAGGGVQGTCGNG